MLGCLVLSSSPPHFCCLTERGKHNTYPFSTYKVPTAHQVTCTSQNIEYNRGSKMKFEPSDLAICETCGTQFDVSLDQNPESCRICDVGDVKSFLFGGDGARWVVLLLL